MKKKKNYRYVRAWGNMLGSLDYYITDQIARAQKMDAPVDATYYDDQERRWHTVSELRTASQGGNTDAQITLERIERAVAEQADA